MRPQALELVRQPRVPYFSRMRALRYLGRLIGEFFHFAWQNKAWWIVPIVLVLLLLTVFIIAGTSVAPFIYTLF
jgi:hypothetical protein